MILKPYWSGMDWYMLTPIIIQWHTYTNIQLKQLHQKRLLKSLKKMQWPSLFIFVWKEGTWVHQADFICKIVKFRWKFSLNLPRTQAPISSLTFPKAIISCGHIPFPVDSILSKSFPSKYSNLQLFVLMLLFALVIRLNWG